MTQKRFRAKGQICALIILCLFFSVLPVNAKAEDTAYAYNGFAGIYQKICINNKTVCQKDDKFVLTDGPTSDLSDLFLPRYMGDGSYAFENKKTEKRIAKAERGGSLPAALYNIRKSLTPQPDDFAGLDDNTQHWILERKDDTDIYYLKSLDNELYMGVSEDGCELIAVGEEQKAEITFQPVPDESPLYLLSLQPGYDTLPENQRTQIERVYESVAGDVFETCSPYGTGEKKTPRAAIDNYYYTKIKGQNMTADAFHNSVTWRFNNSAGFSYVTLKLLSGYNVRTDLPGTQDAYYRLYPEREPFAKEDNGTTRYPYILEVHDKDANGGERVQTIKISIEDSIVGRKNADTFGEVLAHIPYELRSHIKDATCYKSPTPGSGVYQCSATHLNIILATTASVYTMIESIVHELGHSIDCWYYSDYGNSRYSTRTEWKNAMASDCYSVSDYSHTSSLEDFAEFCRFYFTGYTKQDWRRALMILCPERSKAFKRIRMKVMDGYSLWDDGPEKELTVYFDYNDDGTTQPSRKTAEQYSRYGEIMPAEPTGPERVFLGWYTRSVGGEEIAAEQRIMDGEDHTLYAHWSDPPGKEITIHFNPDNGEPEFEIKARKNTRISQIIPDPERSGFSFFGWCTTKGFSERFDPRSDLVLFDDDDVCLKAQWDPLPYTTAQPSPTDSPDTPTPKPTETAPPDTPTPKPTETAMPDPPSPAPTTSAAPNPTPMGTAVQDPPSPTPTETAMPDPPSPAPTTSAAPSPTPAETAVQDPPSPTPTETTSQKPNELIVDKEISIEKISAASDSPSIAKASIHMYVPAGYEQEAAFILAVYKDNVLQSLKFINETVTGDKQFEAEIEVENGATVKAMLWDGKQTPFVRARSMEF